VTVFDFKLDLLQIDNVLRVLYQLRLTVR